MTIDDVYFPVQLSDTPSYTPNFNNIQIKVNGRIQSVIQRWSGSLGIWEVSRDTAALGELARIYDFLLARAGNGRAFKFLAPGKRAFVNQLIGTGDGADTTFQLIRTYTDPVNPTTEMILYPKRGTVSFKVGAVNELQTLSATGTVESGTFTLTYGGEPTAGIPWNAAKVDVERALRDMRVIDGPFIQCAGGPLPTTPVTISFIDELGCQNVATLTVDNTNLVGGGTMGIAATTAGAAGSAPPTHTVNFDTGVVTFGSAPALGDKIFATAEYYVPAIIETDMSKVSWKGFAGGLERVTIAEVIP